MLVQLNLLYLLLAADVLVEAVVHFGWILAFGFQLNWASNLLDALPLT